MARRLTTAASWDGPDLLLRLQVQPRAHRNEIVGTQGECVKVRISAAPVDGLANEQLIAYLAEVFGVSKSRVLLVRGHSAKIKLARILSPERLPTQLGLAGTK
ncbi:MAG: DUF167 domain-containing protein [Acidiferrobacterales bacterium]